MSERNEVRSEVADADTGERAAISGSKLGFYGNVISDMYSPHSGEEILRALGDLKGIYR